VRTNCGGGICDRTGAYRYLSVKVGPPLSAPSSSTALRKIIIVLYHCSWPGFQIRRRLKELDEEWDIERAIEANAGAIGFTGLLLSFVDRRWIALPLLVTGFLLQHAVQGWCPPVPVLRRIGFRTSYEIEQEL
jgi:hypothetical protein